MQKKKLYTRISCILAVGMYTSYVHAQVTVNLPEANITGRTEYQVPNVFLGNNTNLLSLLMNITIKSAGANFNNSPGGAGPAPLSLAHFQLNSVGGIPVLGSSQKITLTAATQPLFAAVLTLLPGAVTSDIFVTTSGFTWVAGTYATHIELTAPKLLGGNAMSLPSQEFKIVVPAYITPYTSAGTISLLVNNFNYYRTLAGISIDKAVTLANTVIYVPSLQASNSNFSFSTMLPYNSIPITSSSLVTSTLNGISAATPITLSTTAQALTPAAGLVVPTNNAQTLNYTYSIDAAKLKAGFLQAGTYSVPLTYTWNKPTNTYPSGALQAQSNGTLEVIIQDMSELVTNQPAVNLTFATDKDYQNGVNQDIPAHITLSKTSPYNLYVRATTSNFTSDVNSIPLNVMRIGPMPGQTGLQTITLSSTAQQLISTADPVIDRSLNIRYSIPASETNKLLNKPAGTYTTTVIFSFVAP